jgi:serine/threonine-protein kinase
LAAPITPIQTRTSALGSSADAARDDLQARVLVFTRLMFAAFTVLIVFLMIAYQAYPEIEPPLNRYIVGGEIVGLAAMGVIWRGLLARRDVSIAWLYRIDIIYGIGIGAAFGSSAILAPYFKPAAWTSLIFTCFSVFTRALFVPSTGRRTAVVSALTFVPLLAAAYGLAAFYAEDLPGPAFAVGATLVSAVVVLIAATGSRIIYGLRQEVTEARQLGVYTLDRMIGKGGMGEVYRAHHALLRRETAVKLMRSDRPGVDVERFEREVHAMSRLTHPNTVAVYDFGRNSDGRFYYAMEYLGGGLNLESLVRQHGAQPAGRVVDILAQVCGALAEAHGAGIVHRDIKPANIILCERGGVPDVAKVVDYGLARELTQNTGDSKQAILGTPDYMAPEAATGPAGPSSDLYALGAVGYFLLTGKRVFESKTALDAIVQHVTATPKPLSEHVEVPAELEALVLACLAKTPDQRPASAAALKAALRAIALPPGWNEEAAARWWSEEHTGDDAGASLPTMTITVDLEHRH